MARTIKQIKESAKKTTQVHFLIQKKGERFMDMIPVEGANMQEICQQAHEIECESAYNETVFYVLANEHLGFHWNSYLAHKHFDHGAIDFDEFFAILSESFILE